MAIVFTYTKSTNIVVVTGGTSGTPATFADFVTADRAGSVTLLAAWIPNSNTKALTYQITPVEKLALLISFVVAAKTAEADYIFITGTDAWGAAQTESIDVTAGNGTYVSTKRFRTITNIDCSDNAAGGGTVWADGNIAVSQPQWGVIWGKGNNQYQVDCLFDIGDGTTSTSFTSVNEQIFYSGTLNSPKTFANATLIIGAPSNTNYSKNGSAWRFPGRSTGRTFATSTSTVKIYASLIVFDNDEIYFGSTGTFTIYDSTFLNVGAVYKPITFGTNTLSARNVYLHFCAISLNGVTLSEFTDVWIEGSTSGFLNLTTNNTYISPKVTNTTTDYYTNGANLTVINPFSPIVSPMISGVAGKWIHECYYCNINICDKNGVAISGAVVDCVDQYNTAAWTVGTVTTDASGNITQQTIIYKQWIETTEILTTYSPHKFTISKAGYQTLVLDAITVSAPIKWHLELQDPTVEASAGIRQPFVFPEPEMIPIPIPMNMGEQISLIEKDPNEMNQKEFEQWRRLNSKRGYYGR